MIKKLSYRKLIMKQNYKEISFIRIQASKVLFNNFIRHFALRILAKNGMTNIMQKQLL